MKKLFALLIAAMLLCGVAAAETVDAYTTASATKTVLSGEALAAAEALRRHTERKENFYTILISGADDENGGDGRSRDGESSNAGGHVCVSPRAAGIVRDAPSAADADRDRVSPAVRTGRRTRKCARKCGSEGRVSRSRSRP